MALCQVHWGSSDHDPTIIQQVKPMASVVIIDDEEILREEIASYLRAQGHMTYEGACLADFYPIMDKAEIAILDLNLPDGLGFEAVSRMREVDTRAGIILLTARGATPDKLVGYSAGADHYIVKPVNLRELDAIINAMLRRVAKGWRVYRTERMLICPDGCCETLSSTEMKLFEMIATAPSRTVKRQSLVEAMGYDWINYDQRRLDTQISRLRHRWAEKCDTPLPLKTEHRIGYSFSADILFL